MVLWTLDADGIRTLAPAQVEQEQSPGHVERGEEGRHDPDGKGDGEPADGAGPELEEDQGRNQGGDLGIHNR